MMADEGLSGAVRDRSHQTYISAKDGAQFGDLVNRNFTASIPNRIWVADFTYCSACSGLVYIAFIVDEFSRMIVGWHMKTTRPIELNTVRSCMSPWQRRRHEYVINDDELPHHSDSAAQYLAFRFSKELIMEAFLLSVGSVSESHDNSLTASTFSLFKTKAMAKNHLFHIGLFKTMADVEYAIAV